jgi:hypothetical protein
MSWADDDRVIGVLADLLRQLSRVADRPIVHLHDDVIGLDAGLVRRIAGRYRAHLRVRHREHADVADFVFVRRRNDLERLRLP